jgi:hypothetical protein
MARGITCKVPGCNSAHLNHSPHCDEHQKMRNMEQERDRAKTYRLRRALGHYSGVQRYGEALAFFKSSEKCKNWIKDHMKWLGKAEEGHTENMYLKMQDSITGRLPTHRYSRIFYVSSQTVSDYQREGSSAPTHLRALANGEFGVPFSKYNKIGDQHPLMKVAEECLSRIELRHNFRGHFYSTKVAGENDIDQPKSCMGRENLFSLAFRCIEIHVQTNEEMGITIYPPHCDKVQVGSLVIFLQLSGRSFNFALYPSSKQFEDYEKDQGYSEYMSWIDGLKKGDAKGVKQFEKDMKKEAKSCYHGIRIFEMKAGDRLCFPAQVYPHGTIIPKQEDGTKRSLAVYHNFTPC